MVGDGGVTLLRGVGPTLAQFGITGFLRDPTIELYSGNVKIASNDNWQDVVPGEIGKMEDARLAVGAFALTSPSDAALLVTLPAGAYTLQVRGSGEQSGIALAEIHEISHFDFDAAVATNAVGLDQTLTARPSPARTSSSRPTRSSASPRFAGADGGTREEMARAMRSSGDNALLQSAAVLRRALKTAEDPPSGGAWTRGGALTDLIEWSAANRLFGQQGYAFRDPFFLCGDGCGAVRAA